MADVKINIIGILGVIGAILLILSVFLNWVDVSLGAGSMQIFTDSATGWDLYTDSDTAELTSYYYVPLVALIAGIIGVISTVLPVASNKPGINKGFGFLALILAIVALVFLVLFMNDFSGDVIILGVKAKISMAYGFWIAVAGAALIIIGGIASIARKTA